MLAKAMRDCFGVAAILAGLAFAAAQTKFENRELLTTILVTGCFIAIGIGLLFFVAFLVDLTYRYFHAVRVMPGQWYPRYWPLQRIAQVGGIENKHEDRVGVLKLICQAQFGSGETTFTRYGRAFFMEVI